MNLPFILSFNASFIIKSQITQLMQIKNGRTKSLGERNFQSDHEGSEVKKIQRQSWTFVENRLYVDYLKENLQIMQNAEQRRINKVFKQLEAKIQSRNSKQIKSHHQKLMLKHKNVVSIIRQVEKEINMTYQGGVNDKILGNQSQEGVPTRQNIQFKVFRDLPTLHLEGIFDRLLFVDPNNEYPLHQNPHDEDYFQ